MSLQSELQSRIARRQNAITTLTAHFKAHVMDGDYHWAKVVKQQIADVTCDQALDKKLMRHIPWAEMYEITPKGVGFNMRPL